jgi:hypothetical protein
MEVAGPLAVQVGLRLAGESLPEGEETVDGSARAA